jgi:hypothetical protein
LGDGAAAAGAGAHLTLGNASKKRRNALILMCGIAFPLAALAILFYFRGSGQRRAIADAAIYEAQASPQMAEMIGRPIEPGWPVRGSVVMRGGDGNADLRIPLHGPRGRGMLTEWAQREGGRWHVCSLHFHEDTGADLMLADAAGTHCEAE